MKRKTIFLSIIVTLVLGLGGCGSSFEPPFEAPEGFSWYSSSQIAFLHRASWHETRHRGIDLFLQPSPMVGLPNLNVVSGRRDRSFADKDLEEYRAYLETSLRREAPGATITNPQRMTETHNEIDVIRFTFTTRLGGATLTQEQVVIQADRRTVVITFTRADGASRDFIEEVLEHLIIV